jgi:hypothetical protein
MIQQFDLLEGILFQLDSQPTLSRPRKLGLLCQFSEGYGSTRHPIHELLC